MTPTITSRLTEAQRLYINAGCVWNKAQHDGCDHQWEVIDASFDHAHGTKREFFRECVKCGELREAGQ